MVGDIIAECRARSPRNPHYAFSYIDWQIIAVISPQLRAELGLSDSALGAIKGLAFSRLQRLHCLSKSLCGLDGV
jgi:hypothetical protein